MRRSGDQANIAKQICLGFPRLPSEGAARRAESPVKARTGRLWPCRFVLPCAWDGPDATGASAPALARWQATAGCGEARHIPGKGHSRNAGVRFHRLQGSLQPRLTFRIVATPITGGNSDQARSRLPNGRTSPDFDRADRHPASSRPVNRRFFETGRLPIISVPDIGDIRSE